MELKTFTIEDIRSWEPYYDPSIYLPEDWSGNALDILRMEYIPHHERLWYVLREDAIDAKTLRRFAAWCARSVEHLFAAWCARSVEHLWGGSAWDVARDVAWDGAMAAAMSSDGSAARAWSATREAQVQQLIKMLEEA